jgi:predicted nucleic acid-binding protein
MTRLILDSNVWAVYAYGRSLRRLVFLRDVYGFEILYAGQILKEVYSTCSKISFVKKNIDPDEVISIIKDMGVLVSYFPRYMLSPDLKDSFLYDIYIQNKAQCLITQEKRLLGSHGQLFRVRNIQWLKENYPH